MNAAPIFATRHSRIFFPVANRSSSQLNRGNEFLARCSLLDRYFLTSWSILWLLLSRPDHVDFSGGAFSWLGAGRRAVVLSSRWSKTRGPQSPPSNRHQSFRLFSAIRSKRIQPGHLRGER